MNYLDSPKLARLTNEIHFFNEQGIKVSIEVGKRLSEAKNEFPTSEEWISWTESEFGYKKSQTYKLVSIANKFHSSGNLFEGKTINEVYALTAFDEEELNHPVQLPSGEIKAPIDMTNKEIEEYKRQAKEAESKARTAQEQAERYARELRERPTIEKPVSMPGDKARINELENQLRNMGSRLEIASQKIEQAENMRKMYEKDSKEYQELKNKIEFLHREKNDLHRQIESATALSGLVVEIDNFLKTKLAPIRYSRALERMDSEVAVRNLTEILDTVDAWSAEMRNFIPKNRKVVIDYDPAS